MRLARPRTLLLIIAIGARALVAQPARSDERAVLQVTRLHETPRLDARLDDAAWSRATPLTDFTQRDPEVGTRATERTTVRLLATDDALWIAIDAEDGQPAGIRAVQRRRDADLSTDDQFTVMLSPMEDRRTGFIFTINPAGALYDSEILTFESENSAWDGVWDARATITDRGWQAEIRIPWSSLRYRPGATTWAANLRRFIRRKNEESLWQAWRRPEGIRFLERAGTLAGLEALPGRARVEWRPYVATAGDLATRGAGDTIIAAARTDASAGLDAKLAPTATTTLDITINADFAQAEVDRQIVNLTRFPLFFPEQRVFFTEGAGIFDFGRARQSQLFYSRRIGLAANGTPIPLVAGARFGGRIGRHQVGAIVARTGGDEDATDIVLRVKRDLLGRGYVGAMATYSDPRGRAGSPAYGVDFNFPWIVGGQNVVVLGNVAATQDSLGGPARTHARLVFDYPNDNADIVLRVDRLADGYQPRLGFVPQAGITRVAGSIDLTPRPHRWGIRRFDFSLLGFDIVHDLDGRINNASLEVRPLGWQLQSGGGFELNLQRAIDVPSEPFEVFPGTTLAPARYEWNRVETVVRSSPRRPVAATLTAAVGGFYDARANDVNLSLRAALTPQWLIVTEAVRTDVRRQGAGFVATTLRLRSDWAASPRLNLTLFGQWDNESERMSVNTRVRWIPSPGSDVFLVWNSAWPTDRVGGVPWQRPQRGGLVLKYVQYLRT
jgi:hypothetical protein